MEAARPSARVLLERAAQLDRIDGLLDRAGAGAGGVVVIEAAAGIGKTALLAEARERGSSAGFRVLSARGGELEREMAFGVARQLLEEPIVSASEEEQAALLAGAAGLARAALGLGDAGAAPSDPFAVLHGLYWICSNLCDRAPVLLAVDDAHWADMQSLRWLAYLARRLEGLPLAVLLASRPDEAGTAREAIAAMVVERTAEPLGLGPLSADAVAVAVRQVYGDADDAFCGACHTASGGNPLFLRELLAATAEGGIAAVAAEAGRVKGLETTGISRYVHARLARLGASALVLAEAVAVLGAGGATLRQAARLADLPPEEAARTADALRTADVLRGDAELEFVHPLVRAAVYGDIRPSARSEAHAAAARIVFADGASPDRVAAHLRATEPRGDEWAVEQLRSAAGRALEAGAPDAAAGLLERALDEPPPQNERIDVLIECGTASSPVNPNAAVERFAAALELAHEPARRGAIAIRLAKALAFSDRMGEAVAMLDSILAELAGEDEELVRLVECELLLWAHFWLDDPAREAHSRRLRRMAEGLAGESVSQRAALALLAWDFVTSDAPVDETLAVASRALGPGRFLTDPDQGFEMPTCVAAAYMFSDELDRAFELFDRGVAELRSAGWLVHLAFTYAHRAHVRLRQGVLLEAEADAQTAWELAGQLGPTFPAWWYAFGIYIQILLARGSEEAAHDLLESTGIGDASPDAVIFPFPRLVRAQLLAARGEHQRAAEELMEFGPLMEQRRFRNPSWIPWRTIVAPSLAALGREDEARAVIGEAVQQARRIGAPLALGAALRTAAQFETGEAALDLLSESLEVLEPSPARLEYAHSLVAYGAALRRGGRRADSREPLRAGLELAHRCGALALEQLAGEELQASGARPRSVVRTGVDALTPSERRVCQLAADGLNNPHIAQTLFVTRRTVESHLASAYRKLDITSRAELGRVLGAAG